VDVISFPGHITSYFLKTNHCVILSILGLTARIGIFLSDFLPRTVFAFLIPRKQTAGPNHPTLLASITIDIFSKKSKIRNSSLCNFPILLLLLSLRSLYSPQCSVFISPMRVHYEGPGVSFLPINFKRTQFEVHLFEHWIHCDV
jgi:hypothetical protein